jgi:hypothetical protein
MIRNLFANHLSRLAVLGGLAVVLAVALLAVSLHQSAQAAQPAEPAEPQGTWFSCAAGNIQSVAAFAIRVHMACKTAYSDSGTSITYWAYPTSDSAGASRILSLFTTAQVTGKTLLVYFTPGDTSGSAWGCGASDCRRITAAEIQ